MIAATEAEPVAKQVGHGGRRPGSGRPKKDRDDVTVKMDRQMVALARFVAEMRGVATAEYLDTLRAAIERDFASATKAMGKGKLSDS